MSSFLAGIGSAILGPVLGGLLPNKASNVATDAAEQAFQAQENGLEISSLTQTAATAVRAHHFQHTMEVADEDAKEANLMQNYTISLEDADKKNIEKLMSQIASGTG